MGDWSLSEKNSEIKPPYMAKYLGTKLAYLYVTLIQSSLTMITAVELIMDEYDLGPPE